ncbi:hypothetical protein BU26DRAFT_568778 [Trematosphaeria pertusa]|uniref:Uncharacterized protein n=1 Tax=Trematosphaeria pertusa TaxID=390896 RepID=A0A6A6I447_9PLEO|nr:uncharacterized protein BU26DRAFT_568778 [Trematosphaeria pertusa]KAF2244778.1 hypothetical protein BU26DRAFT_568778 [Trematosphaeria pertusa]
MAKSKTKNRKNKQNAAQHSTEQSTGHSSSVQTSISGSKDNKTYDGTTEPPTPTTMSSYATDVERRDSAHPNMNTPQKPLRARRPCWKKWMPRPCQWWPCRASRWIRDFVLAVFHVSKSAAWRDLLFSGSLLALFLFGCWVAMEGLLHVFRPVAAQDANCSVVYVTIPGPIITVSLIGATPSDPNHGTYYFSVINGTTHWHNSIAPPTRFSTLVTVTPGITITSHKRITAVRCTVAELSSSRFGSHITRHFKIDYDSLWVDHHLDRKP